jgi:hypothetical protein
VHQAIEALSAAGQNGEKATVSSREASAGVFQAGDASGYIESISEFWGATEPGSAD